MREILRREALAVWMAGVKHGDANAHRAPNDERANEADIAYWRDAEVAFDRWWARQTRRRLQRRDS